MKNVRIVVITVLLTGGFLYYFNQEDANERISATPPIDQTEAIEQAKEAEPVQLLIGMDEPEGEPQPLPQFFEDQYMQAAAEYMIKENLVSPHEVIKMSQTHVLIGVSEYTECLEPDPASPVIVNGMGCAKPVASSPIPQHPYIGYETESLESLARSDAIAAAVLGERLFETDQMGSLQYSMYATALSGKVGPIMNYRESLKSVPSMRAGKPVTFDEAFEAESDDLARMFALNNIAISLGGEGDAFLDGYYENMSPSFKQNVNQHTYAMETVLEIVKEELGS